MRDISWEEVPAAVDSLVKLCRVPSFNIKQATSRVFTLGDIGYYFSPYSGTVALHSRDGTVPDVARCKHAAGRSGLDVESDLLTDGEVMTGFWVKVAFSPTLRATGEALNFFPGHYPGGIPNHASPLAAMLTTAIVGGGAGYLGGKLLKRLLPDSYGDKLPRAGAVLGSLAGGSTSVPWMVANKQQGLDWNDPQLLDGQPDSPRVVEPDFDVLKESMDAVRLGADCTGALDRLLKSASTFGGGYVQKQPTPLDVNINSLGQTLWESGASPQLSATTMGAMYAASQMPDPRAKPGWVTGHQLGQLATNAASDYIKGLQVGAVLNGVVGTPWRTPMFGVGGATLGLIGAVVPRLFGG